MKRKKLLCLSLTFFILFCLWTLLVLFVDVEPIGPRESSVGLAFLNRPFHNFIGSNMTLYTVTDWLGLVPILVAFAFAVLGLIQLIKRRSLFKVECSILTLGVFYILVMSAYVLFEFWTLNYRPVLINGYLEGSYPSSTTLLVTCVMPASAIELNRRIKNKSVRCCILFLIAFFTLFMVVGRIISGVHWISDIIGGLFLGLSLDFLFLYCVKKSEDS